MKRKRKRFRANGKAVSSSRQDDIEWWERMKLEEWRERGMLRPDGTLRAGREFIKKPKHRPSKFDGPFRIVDGGISLLWLAGILLTCLSLVGDCHPFR